jgi:hypothetical protein
VVVKPTRGCTQHGAKDEQEEQDTGVQIPIAIAIKSVIVPWGRDPKRTRLSELGTWTRLETRLTALDHLELRFHFNAAQAGTVRPSTRTRRRNVVVLRH